MPRFGSIEKNLLVTTPMLPILQLSLSSPNLVQHSFRWIIMVTKPTNKRGSHNTNARSRG